MCYVFVYLTFLNKKEESLSIVVVVVVVVFVVVKPRAVDYLVMVLVASLSTRRLGISYMSIHVEFMMDKSATGPFSLTV